MNKIENNYSTKELLKILSIRNKNKEITKCKVAGPANDKLKCRDINFKNRDSLIIGNSLKLTTNH